MWEPRRSIAARRYRIRRIIDDEPKPRLETRLTRLPQPVDLGKELIDGTCSDAPFRNDVALKRVEHDEHVVGSFDDLLNPAPGGRRIRDVAPGPQSFRERLHDVGPVQARAIFSDHVCADVGHELSRPVPRPPRGERKADE